MLQTTCVSLTTPDRSQSSKGSVPCRPEKCQRVEKLWRELVFMAGRVPAGVSTKLSTFSHAPERTL